MIEVRIVPDEGDPYDLTVTSRDVMAWERTTKGMTFAKFQEQFSMTHLYNLAYRAAMRTRKFTGTLDDFESTVDIDLLEGDSDETDPTSRGA